MWKEIQEKIYQTLLFLTNNEKKPVAEWRHDEILFDIGFFLALVISVVIGFILVIASVIAYLNGNEKLAWCLIFLFWGIEYCVFGFVTAFDNIRHNREE